MTLTFPSRDFDESVAGVCHGSATEMEMRALNELLRSNPSARDAYLFRIELHTRLASNPNLFFQGKEASKIVPIPETSVAEVDRARRSRDSSPTTWQKLSRGLALAACLILTGVGVWSLWFRHPATQIGATSKAVAMLTRVVDARWSQSTGSLRVGGALEPGWLRLESGLAQIVFYTGARVVIEGPTEFQLVSQGEAVCLTGRLLAEVPPPARGFRLKTEQLNVVDLGTSFGIDATHARTEVHVFKGTVELHPGKLAKQTLNEGGAAVVAGSAAPRLMPASAIAFTPMFEFQKKSLASEAVRYDQWRFASARLNQDPSLVVHLDFENLGDPGGTLHNATERNPSVVDATIVGCQRGEGRWREKPALEFQSVNDRVRLAVPGQFNALTISAWVCVKGLDRQIDSLFMCDGFELGTVHWLIRRDGALGLTVMDAISGKNQIVASAPVITLDKFGMWLHLAVVLDGDAKRVAHYLNGVQVSEEALRMQPPFRISTSELGNWNPNGFRGNDPSLIRNFSGAMDEFCLFGRALSAEEIHALHADGQPQTEP